MKHACVASCCFTAASADASAALVLASLPPTEADISAAMMESVRAADETADASTAAAMALVVLRFDDSNCEGETMVRETSRKEYEKRIGG